MSTQVLEGFVAITAAARRLEVTPLTVRTWIDTGKLRGVRDPAGRRLVIADDLERLVAERLAAKGGTGANNGA